MKVCTDSCILGAWTALRLKNAKNILDIGTGTGLLPLMLAQKNEVMIDAVESDPESAGQAMENISQTNWNNRIRVLHADVLHHEFESGYDFIITNPPFFESDLHSPEESKNRAKHDESLTLAQVARLAGVHLRTDGFFSILLPFHRSGYFENLAAEYGFFPSEKLTIRQTPAHIPFRSIGLFSRSKPPTEISDELTIKDGKGKYTSEFTQLMKEYY